MGLLSRVARVAGKVVSTVGGERGHAVVEQARAVRSRMRGEEPPSEPEAPLPWPARVAPIWDRGHDLLSNQWPTGTFTLRRRWAEIATSIEARVPGEDGVAIASGWRTHGEAFIGVWEATGASVADAWEQALRAPDAMTAEGMLDSAIQTGWRHIREAWVPVRLDFRATIQRAGERAGKDEEHIKAALAPVDAVWGRTETQLSDRFLDGGGYLVSLVREVSDGNGHPGEILDTVQQLLAQQDSTWVESIDGFAAAWLQTADALAV